MSDSARNIIVFGVLFVGACFGAALWLSPSFQTVQANSRVTEASFDALSIGTPLREVDHVLGICDAKKSAIIVKVDPERVPGLDYAIQENRQGDPLLVYNGVNGEQVEVLFSANDAIKAIQYSIDGMPVLYKGPASQRDAAVSVFAADRACKTVEAQLRDKKVAAFRNNRKNRLAAERAQTQELLARNQPAPPAAEQANIAEKNLPNDTAMAESPTPPPAEPPATPPPATGDPNAASDMAEGQAMPNQQGFALPNMSGLSVEEQSAQPLDKNQANTVYPVRTWNLLIPCAKTVTVKGTVKVPTGRSEIKSIRSNVYGGGGIATVIPETKDVEVAQQQVQKWAERLPWQGHFVGMTKIGEVVLRYEGGGLPTKHHPHTARFEAGVDYRFRLPALSEMDREYVQGIVKDLAAEKQKEKPSVEGTSQKDDAEWRTWTDLAGNITIEAQYRGTINGQVKLMKRDGSTTQVPLESLSDEDRTWIKTDAIREKDQADNSGGKWRTWTDVSGKFSIEAQYKGTISGKVKLLKRDGSTVQLPLDRLSDTDKLWIKRGK